MGKVRSETEDEGGDKHGESVGGLSEDGEISGGQVVRAV